MKLSYHSVTGCTVICLAFLASEMSAQQVNVKTPVVPGMTLVGPGGGDFRTSLTQLLGLSITPSVNDWLPYSAILRNTSGQPIRAVIATWTLNYPTESSDSHTYDQSFPPPGEIPSGTSVVVLPVWIFTGPVPAGQQDPTNQPSHADTLTKFQAANTISVALDGVIFASGQFVGPDVSHHYELQVARQAAMSVYSTVIARVSGGDSDGDIVAWLQTVASAPKIVAVRASSQSTLDQAEAARCAAELLRIYKNQGSAGMYSFSQARYRPFNLFR